MYFQHFSFSNFVLKYRKKNNIFLLIEIRVGVLRVLQSFWPKSTTHGCLACKIEMDKTTTYMMKYHIYTFSLLMLVICATSASESTSVCRDYLRVIEYFPNGKTCAIDNLPTSYDLQSVGIEMTTVAFLEEHCCTFGGGDRVAHHNSVFENLRKFTGKPVSEFQYQYSPSQKALFWLVTEDSYPNLANYLHIEQRFALASIYFGLNGDTDWVECSARSDTSCSVPNNKTAWMSGAQECEWAYLKCDRNLFVTELIMRKLLIIILLI